MKPSAYKWNIAALKAIAPHELGKGEYSNFDFINGNHPWKFAVPNGFIEYQARILRKSKVIYFNFSLAKEMGLLTTDHPNNLNKELEKKLIETFALRIINEYDQLTGAKFIKKDIKPHRYMATRYLQLQHSCKRGETSGDGRSMWNGHFTSPNGVDWDISSCGTGVTRLSPGAVHSGKPVKTGDRSISYGSGLADIDEGLTAAILSESFHHRGILTERTLLVIEGPEGKAINVRAAKNLLRPSHLFLHLKQNNQLMLKSALDLYIRKQIFNGDWPAGIKDINKYDVFLKKIAQNYANFAARLEDEYIFCWLDWDGDNMLLDGGIIDYGSIRQFGICHHHYRYDDVDRFSTNLKEQKTKAKYLVQQFCQLVDFVKTGEKKHIKNFSKHPLILYFEKVFQNKRTELLLKRAGIPPNECKKLMKTRPHLVDKFIKKFRTIERKESSRGKRNTPDGVNHPVIFNTKPFLKELPRRILVQEHLLPAPECIELLKTTHLTKKEAEQYKKSTLFEGFQKTYIELIRASYKGKNLRRALLETSMRASLYNRTDYVTGDGIILVVEHLLKKRKKVGRMEFLKIIDSFISQQKGTPASIKLKKKAKKILSQLTAIVSSCEDSI